MECAICASLGKACVDTVHVLVATGALLLTGTRNTKPEHRLRTGLSQVSAMPLPPPWTRPWFGWPRLWRTQHNTIAAWVRTKNKAGHPSRWAMSRWLQADGLQWLTKQPKPFLTEGHWAVRLAFARRKATRDWTRVFFSDECSFVLFRQKSKGWRLPGELKLRLTVKYPQKCNVMLALGMVDTSGQWWRIHDRWIAAKIGVWCFLVGPLVDHPDVRTCDIAAYGHLEPIRLCMLREHANMAVNGTSHLRSPRRCSLGGARGRSLLSLPGTC